VLYCNEIPQPFACSKTAMFPAYAWSPDDTITWCRSSYNEEP
jgi:lysosomal Pro-X carboxypeptidase